MNIKEAETLSGVSKRNIRFYEQKGLLLPERNRENDYREYSEADIETLKLIRALRMLDMPLDQVREVVLGKVPLRAAAASHKKTLKDRIRELETAARFCDELSAEENLDIDAVLCRMEEPENREKLSKRGDRDYADTMIRAALSLTAGLIPCFAGIIFGLTALGLWFDIPVISYLISFSAMLLWGAFGYWTKDQGIRLWEAVLIHVIPAAACACYVLTVDMMFNPFDLFILGCYFPIMATFVPFSSFVGGGILAMTAPLFILVISFFAGYAVAAFVGKTRRSVSVGFLVGAAIAIPVVAVCAGILFAPLPTIATPEYLQNQLNGENPVWVKSGEACYEVVGSPEFCDLFRMEEWERKLVWTKPGEPNLEVHLRSDPAEPYAIEFYADGTVRVYETWITTEAGYFQAPKEAMALIVEYAQERGTP